MIEESLKRYRIYEYIRDTDTITKDMSSTKKLILKLMEKDSEAKNYCIKKMNEEMREVEEAMEGNHFHKNMTKREILVNEISQYIYWQTIIAVSENISCEEFDEEGKIREILKKIDISKIGEKKEITVKEIIAHDLMQMKSKDYLRAVI